MSALELTLATSPYDYLQPLRDGRVRAEGLRLNLLSVPSSERHHHMLEHAAYDAAEFSMGTYLVMRAQGLDVLRAIPFIARRMFPHRFCFVRADGVERPEDLRGRRVGVLSYQNSLALWLKGLLARQHGVRATDATWVTTGAERVPVELPADIRIERAHATLESLLLAGDIDLMAAPNLPRSWLEGDGRLRPLFEDPEAAERSFHRETGVFPIMHPVVIREAILDRHPWVATSLFEALRESQRLHAEDVAQPHRTSVVWPRRDEERAFFGRDPFAQGFAANRRDVASWIELAVEQGLLREPLPPEALFAPITLET
ncbi:MAG: ABC transporter substrate-binding protein [Sandaracinaceae bacterium]|nr:ABC transporter substrate-binding protein [Sandaracinaceae bacterium]